MLPVGPVEMKVKGLIEYVRSATLDGEPLAKDPVVRMTIANLETLVANSVRRAMRLGDRAAVPRISDLPATVPSSTGKLELEYAGAERSEREVTEGLIQRATRLVFDARVPLEGVASVHSPRMTT